ncbi:MAG: YibE/F family protein [Treponema sp.]|nr:YibE/F family protein [Treponema sp.]
MIISVVLLFIGNRFMDSRPEAEILFEFETYELVFFTGVVTQIMERNETRVFGLPRVSVTFNARITGGPRRGEVVAVEQVLDNILVNEREVSIGNRVLLVYDELRSRYFFVNYLRINYVALLGAAFVVLVILFGRRKGFNGIVALGITCMAIFLVFVPAILAGRNIYIAAMIVCVFSIVSTLLIVIGANKKALCAMLGCLGGLLAAALLMLVMDFVLRLTGAVSEEIQILLLLPVTSPINLRALIFAGVILGAVGAIMDVAMSIASSLWELRQAGDVSDFSSILKSGITIGKDILGTMLNTLILAYIGSSLSLILLITVHSPSLIELLNMEIIIVEFLRALVGSFGMLLTIPLTAGICGWFYTARQKHLT